MTPTISAERSDGQRPRLRDMRAAALLVTLVLAARLAPSSGAASANILKTVSAAREQALDRAAQHVRQVQRPANHSSNGGAGAGRGAHADAPAAGHAAGLKEELSSVLWLRYTQPRTMTSVAEHADETVTQGVVVQQLSHDDPDNPTTWQQTYFRCSDSHAAGGPAFVMLSGTADYLPNDWLREGLMATLARKMKADRFFLPTRFFGVNSRPTSDTSVASLKYLTVEEVLRDVASFLDQLLEAGVLQKEQRVVLFGAGFGGAVATWARKRFPDIIHGVVASSATLQATYSFPSYFPVVSYAMDWYHRYHRCTDGLQNAFMSLEQALSLPEGRAEFNRAFAPCTELPTGADGVVSDEDRAHILGQVASVFADVVQEDQDGPIDSQGRPGGDKLWPYCDTLRKSTDTPLTTLGRLVEFTKPGLCLETSFQKLVEALSPTAWTEHVNSGGLRPWLWLQCTELGQLPSTTGSMDSFPYSTRINMAFYTKLCQGAFDETVTANLVNSIGHINNNYGGLKPDVGNAIFVLGDLDPWKGLSPTTTTRDDMHVFSVLRASHAHDLFPRDDYDPPWMKKTRKQVEKIVAGWVKAN